MSENQSRNPNLAVFFLLFPALFSLFPLEILGFNGVFLQRLPLILENGIPYLDFFVIPIVLLICYQLFNGIGTFRCYAFVLPQLLIAIAYLAFARGVAFNQAFGLFLGFSAVAAYSYVLRAEGVEKIRSTLETVMFFQTWFSVLLALGLVAHTVGLVSYASEFLTLIDRFDGEGLRIRWEANRLVDRMVICTSVTWATYKVIGERKIIYATVPLIYMAYQLTQTSRGGVLLVLLSVVIATVLFPAGRVDGRAPGKISSILFMFLTVLGLAGWAFSTESGQVLIASLGEISDEGSIRARMQKAAFDLVSNSPFFGNGYFDIHSTIEWSPFVLPNMLLPLHNVFLHYLVYVGYFGAFFFVGILLLVLKDVLFLLLNRASVLNSVALRQIAGISAAAFMGGIYLIVFQTMDRISWLYFWTFCGILYFVRLLARR